MLNKSTIEWRSGLLFMLFIGMMMALFVSRVLLSASMTSFFVVSLFHAGFKKQVQVFFSSPVLWGMSLLFFLPLLSGLWSTDKKEWLDIVRIKLPLFFLPLAFAGPPERYFNQFSKKQWDLLAYFFILLIVAGTMWSMFHYAANADAVQEGYLRAKSIITPLENDHVRFSWLVSITVLLAGWLCIKKMELEKPVSTVLLLVTIWLIIFLHILAARTGLFSFYIIMFVLSLWLIVKKTKAKYGAILLVILLALPVTAYFTLPTFHNRVKYIMHDRGYFKEAHYLKGSIDAVRVISLKAGKELMWQIPATGVGFGDVFAVTNRWYKLNYPQMEETDKIYPSSEWLIYGMGCGWPGLLLFTGIMFIPFLVPVKNRLVWCIMNGTAAFSFLFDMGLEVQFGVFAYSFLVLWWWKWFNAEKV